MNERTESHPDRQGHRFAVLSMLMDYSLPKIADAARIQLHLCTFSPFRPLTAGLEGAVQQSQYHKGPVFLSFSGHLTPYDSESNPPPNYRNPVLNNPLFSTSSTPSPPHHHSLTSTPSTTAARFAVETRLLGCARAREQRAVGGGRRERYTM